METSDAEEATCIRDSQNLMAKRSLTADLAFMQCHLSFLSAAITRLGIAELPIVEALANDAKLRIQTIPGNNCSTKK